MNLDPSRLVRCTVVVWVVLLAAAASAAGRTGPVELGATVNSGAFIADPDPRYKAALDHYDAITTESAMKILDLRPAQDRWDFAAADAIVAFAEAHGQKVHGHTLTWCEDTWIPAWVKNRSWTRNQLLAFLEDHIARVLAHFRGHVSTWDVVNEAFNADGSLRDCLWSRVIGSDWVEQAFRFARRADPNVQLFYNEIRAEVPNPKFEAVMTMVRDFRARGVPIDGVGEQFHLDRVFHTQEQIEEAMRQIGALGLAVHISEMDVPTWYLGRTVEAKLARQAEIYRTVAAACQAQPACFRITTWGFTDRYSWRGSSSMPLPFDVEYRPKLAWSALQEVLRAPPPAPPPEPPPPAPPAAPTTPAPASATAPRPGSSPPASQTAPARQAARYRGWVGGVSTDDERRRRVQGDYHALELSVIPGRRVRYRVCLRGGSARVRRCFIRRTSTAGRSSINVSRLVNDRGGPGRWRAVWRIEGRRVSSWSFRVVSEGV